MSQDSDPPTKPSLGADKKPPDFQRPAPHLKLIVSNPLPVQENLLPSGPTPISKVKFTAESRRIGPHLYEMRVQDPSHYLSCDVILEVEEKGNEGERRAVICHFPIIADESLNEFIKGDETLHSIIIIQFQMKVLEQLLMFCANHHAIQLFIYRDDTHGAGFEIYHHFLMHYDEAFIENEEQWAMVISSNQQTADALTDFMKGINLKFCQALWRAQRFNPTIRHYLQSHPFA
ncbi:MAG: hypothetical protein K0R76_1073 [Alphaproteobacteria bacterium]|jgi:hypothetical protein|nr:hypothetical protein [Alphaproteobacteria bacterium]